MKANWFRKYNLLPESLRVALWNDDEEKVTSLLREYNIARDSQIMVSAISELNPRRVIE